MQAQLVEGFSSGDLSNWLGDVEKFIINPDEQLQLNDAEANSPAVLFHPFAVQSASVWEAYIAYDFSPSTANFCRFILQSDQTDADHFQGYFLQVGGISGNDDALTLYRKDGSNNTLLLSGSLGAVGGDEVQVRVRVSRDTEGFWTLEADYTGGENWQDEGSVLDDRYAQGTFFGVECRYTSTRSDKFFFDDFKIETTADTIAPKPLITNVLANDSLLLEFDEPIADNAALANFDNYIFDPSIALTNVQLLNPTNLLLTFAEPLQVNINYTLRLQNISDLAGNLVENAPINFIYIPIQEPQFGDIVITEIMADPSPAIGLPEIEYIELYNRSSKGFNLAEMNLSDASGSVILPDYLLQAGEYVLLFRRTENAFSFVENKLALNDFIGLGNTGDELILQSATGELLHQVRYRDDWYGDRNKSDGGWSLEWQTPNFICALNGKNWTASVAVSGGTPGEPNSQYNDTKDRSFEGADRLIVLNDTQLQLLFNERIKPTKSTNYDINNNEIITVTTLENEVILDLAQPLMKGTAYTLLIQKTVSDCLDNTLAQTDSLVFTLPELAAANDLVFNEILFNPATGGSDFIELYNRSDKTIDLQSLFLSDQASDIININASFLLSPKEYVVLTPSPENILQNYSTAQANRLMETDLPSMPDRAGSLFLYRLNEQMQIVPIDAFNYSNDFHNALLDDENGVSLERLRPDSPTQDANNWHSAAAAVGFGTPTVQNTQFMETPELSNDFQLIETQISPDGDGFQDVLLLDYELERAGYIANIRLFDSAGRLLEELVQSELLMAKGTFKWDGNLTNGEGVRPGIYILHVDYFEPNGDRRTAQFAFSLIR